MEQQVMSFLNENYPLQIHTVEAVTNEMYRCTGDQGTYYARVTNYKPYEEQLEEVAWTNWLYREGVGVAPAISSSRGQIVELMPPKGILVVVYKADRAIPELIRTTSLLSNSRIAPARSSGYPPNHMG